MQWTSNAVVDECELPVEVSFANLAESRVAFEQVAKTPGFHKGGRFYPTVPTQPVHSEGERKRARGRPTSYKPEYCEEVIEAMMQGFSLTAFAGILAVGRDVLNDWMARYPDFAEACARGRTMRLHAWEVKALRVADDGGVGSQGTMIIKALNTQRIGDEWQDKTTVELEGRLSLAALVESSLKTVNTPLIEHDQQVTSSGEGDGS